jgi:4-carboxymuconolactone decarboxylase
MKPIKIFLVMGLFVLSISKGIHAQQAIKPSTSLDGKQHSIITISALTAKGDFEQLQKELHNGLDAGLTVNQIKEVLVHIYAYAGFPRSIRGLQTLMSVIQERKAKGINDKIGVDASPINDDRDKYGRGKDILGKLTGTPQVGPPTGYSAFAPAIDTFLKEHLFADIFERDVLSYAERELVTISVLSSISGVEPMLQGHLNISLNVGITPDQLQHFIAIIESSAGKEEAKAAQAVLNGVLQNRKSQ